MDKRTRQLISIIRSIASPLRNDSRDYDALLEKIGDARFVLLGEATHGTHEFYAARAQISQRLIVEKGFQAVAVEADWPDAYRVNCFVKGITPYLNAKIALEGFQRFPEWMWSNTDVENFITWLFEHNQDLPMESRTGFYGLDLYSLYTSIDKVISFLNQVDPEAAEFAKKRYSCFAHFENDPHLYASAVRLFKRNHCQNEAMAQLADLLRHTLTYTKDPSLKEDFFDATQNARLVKNAEEYYRTMFDYDISSWNLRDTHMMETLDTLSKHLSQPGKPAKIVVWEHNSHIGNAKATAMSERGELNIGQLVREKYGDEAILVGFTTHEGNVTAASNWGMPAERKTIRPSLTDSYENLFHQTQLKNFSLILRDNEDLLVQLGEPRLERAIGVVYQPRTERTSHYFHANLLKQFDAVIHFNRTQAVRPLVPTEHWLISEIPETFPSGL